LNGLNGARAWRPQSKFVAANAEASCDCVITDVQTPGMSRLDLKRLIDDRGSSVSVIMITARPDPKLEAGGAI
jgi:FixJ family two-component response regulator